MNESRVEELRVGGWVGWCCSYCAAPLRPLGPGLLCADEQRWFATQDGVHRLLPEERGREIRPFLELRERVRDPGSRDDASHGREAALLHGLELVATHLGPGPWKALEVGGSAASLRLIERGHRAAAVDVKLGGPDGLLAANRVLRDPQVLPRAEAEMDALPVEPASFDLVVAMGSLHVVPRVARALVELRRVTRRGGALLVVDSPVFRRRPDGEAMVAERMRAQARRHPPGLPRESQPSYLVRGELEDLFTTSGWRLDVFGWPARWRDWRRRARFPILLARRDG